MGVYLRGNAINIVQRFFTVDPLTEATTLADPTTVTFDVRDPDGVVTSYVYGVNGNVTKSATGIYLCALAPPLPPGDYGWAAIGTGAVEATGEGVFTVLPSGVLPPVFPTVADYGPCSGWVDGAYVADFDTSLGVGSSTYLLDPVAEVASQLLYELSARQFAGNCQRTVRPCRQTCACFAFSPSLGLGPWAWTSGLVSGIGAYSWRNECGDSCGCGSESYVRLAGYPVQQILQVKIDGVVISPTQGPPPDGNPAHVGGYRLDGRRNLIRLADLTTNPNVPVDVSWPVCQDLSLPDTEPATFSVTYEWGQSPPEAGRMAAAQLAVELWKSQPQNGGVCRLPNRVSRVTRGGVTMDRVVPLAELLRAGATGLTFVDAFIALTNPQGAKRRSAVYSPDLQPFSRKVGQ